MQRKIVSAVAPTRSQRQAPESLRTRKSSASAGALACGSEISTFVLATTNPFIRHSRKSGNPDNKTVFCTSWTSAIALARPALPRNSHFHVQHRGNDDGADKGARKLLEHDVELRFLERLGARGHPCLAKRIRVLRRIRFQKRAPGGAERLLTCHESPVVRVVLGFPDARLAQE